jgi:hypothetical protein
MLMIRWIAFLGLLAGLPGCYGYARTPEPPGRGIAIRAHLSQPQDVRLGEITANSVSRVDGEVIGLREDTLLVSAFWLRTPTGYEHMAKGQTVRIPRENVVAIEQKKFAWGRTGLLAAGIVAVGGLAKVAFDAAGGGGSGNPPPVSK